MSWILRTVKSYRSFCFSQRVGSNTVVNADVFLAKVFDGETHLHFVRNPVLFDDVLSTAGTQQTNKKDSKLFIYEH